MRLCSLLVTKIYTFLNSTIYLNIVLIDSIMYFIGTICIDLNIKECFNSVCHPGFLIQGTGLTFGGG